MFIIDGRNMLTRQEAYAELKRALEAPDYMGSNLDALHDVLSEMRGEIVLIHACAMLNALKKFGLSLLEVIFDATNDNPYLSFSLGMDHAKQNAEN
ncbi:MAG: barstar family protein [Clostridia bacterium]|nr:barstar family protein [Clostridia bacterium]